MIALHPFQWLKGFHEWQTVIHTNTFHGGIMNANTTTTAKRPTAKRTAQGRQQTLARRQARAFKAGALTVTRSSRAKAL